MTTTTTLSQSEVDGIPVIRLSGNLDQAGAEAVGPAFAGAVAGVARRGAVVIDLSAVKVINTPGIGMLLKGHRDLQSGGGRAILAGARGIVADVLRCCQFHRLMSIVDEPSAAVAMARAEGGARGDGGGSGNAD